MIYSGGSVEEVLELAEKELGVLRDSFTYQIIKEKKSLFHGSEITIEITKIMAKGTLCIHDGKVIYTKGDIKPQIEPGSNVSVIINGNKIKSKTHVDEQDEIILETQNSEAERTIDLKISENKMEAVLTIKYSPKREYKIIDKAAANLMIVEAELTSEIFPPKFTREEIEKIISEKNIKFGIQLDKIDDVIKGGSCTIAKGVFPENPVDDKILYLFSLENEKKPVEIDGKVDYYNIGEIECVEKSTILAEKIEGVEGKAGFDIYGNRLHPPKRRKINLLKGMGCEITENGTKVISLIKGMPCLKDNRVCVYDAHIIDGDVDIKTGNIQFDGDVVVKGNINEGMKVWSGNNISVFGEVTNAELTSAGNIKIQNNVISSVLKAGNKQIADMEAVNYIKLFEILFNKLSEMYLFIAKSQNLAAGNKQNQILRVLLQSKFANFKEKIVKGVNFFESSNNINEEMKNLWKVAISIYNEITEGKLGELKKITDILTVISDFLLKFDISLTPADVIINYCQNTNIFATNNVEIKGKGCYNSDISAENEVIFTGYPGIFRGGQIFGSRGIHLKEVGSSAGIVNILKTSKEGVIEAKIAYQNTILYIGEMIYRVENPIKELKAYAEKGEIVVEKFNL